MPKKPVEEIPKTFKGMLYKLFFYKTKEVFAFIILLLFVVIVGLIMLQSVSFGWKDGKFYFNWGKAADIKIEVKKGD